MHFFQQNLETWVGVKRLQEGFPLDQNARQTPSFRAGKDSGDAKGV
jgi:hypothetical protein